MYMLIDGICHAHFCSIAANVQVCRGATSGGWDVAESLHLTDVLVRMYRFARRTLQCAIRTQNAMDPRPPALGIPLFQLQMRRSTSHKLLAAQLSNCLVGQHVRHMCYECPATSRFDFPTSGMLQVCRESEGECDPAETCLGITEQCPDDLKAEKKTVTPLFDASDRALPCPWLPWLPAVCTVAGPAGQ